MGRLHARTLARAGGAELVAVVDTVRARAEALSEATGAAVREAVPRDVDAVIVATPTESHAELGVTLLAAGHWVLLEKPIARTAEEAARLDHPRLVVGHSERFNPLLRGWPRPLPRHLSSTRTLCPRPEEPRDSAAVDLAIHDLDLFLWWTGEGAALIEASGSHHQGRATLRTPSGATASLEFGRRAPSPRRHLRVEERRGWRQADLLAGWAVRDGRSEPPIDGQDALSAQWEAFVRATRGGERLGASATEAAAALALALEIEARTSGR